MQCTPVKCMPMLDGNAISAAEGVLGGFDGVSAGVQHARRKGLGF